MRLRLSVAVWLAAGVLISSCSTMHGRTNTSSLTPAPGKGSVLRDPDKRFNLTVPRDGLRQGVGKFGIALETRNGSRGYSVQVYDWPRAGLSDEEALKTAFKTRMREVMRSGQYTVKAVAQRSITRHGRPGIEAHYLLLPKRGWARRAYVCQIIAADDHVYWMHASMLRTAQFGGLNEKFVQEAHAFFKDVHFADEIKARQGQSPAVAPAAAPASATPD